MEDLLDRTFWRQFGAKLAVFWRQLAPIGAKILALRFWRQLAPIWRQIGGVLAPIGAKILALRFWRQLAVVGGPLAPNFGANWRQRQLAPRTFFVQADSI